MENLNENKFYQSFKIESINRKDIKEAEYNPRFFPEEARKNLKAQIKKHGIVMPLVINKRTGTLISGHLRLSILDELNKNLDYNIDVAVLDVPLETEIKLNLILNNTSLMGEYDHEKMQLLKNDYPELDFIKDVGFTKQDIEFLELDITESEKKETNPEQFEKYKKSYDDFKKKTIEDEKKKGNSVSHPERNDKCVTIVFDDNTQKWEFMQNINQKETEKFIKYDDFTEFIKEDYRI